MAFHPHAVSNALDLTFKTQGKALRAGRIVPLFCGCGEAERRPTQLRLRSQIRCNSSTLLNGRALRRTKREKRVVSCASRFLSDAETEIQTSDIDSISTQLLLWCDLFRIGGVIDCEKIRPKCALHLLWHLPSKLLMLCLVLIWLVFACICCCCHCSVATVA